MCGCARAADRPIIRIDWTAAFTTSGKREPDAGTEALWRLLEIPAADRVGVVQGDSCVSQPYCASIYNAVQKSRQKRALTLIQLEHA